MEGAPRQRVQLKINRLPFVDAIPLNLAYLSAQFDFLGIDHLKLTFRFQGRDYRLTDVAGNVVQKMLA